MVLNFHREHPATLVRREKQEIQVHRELKDHLDLQEAKDRKEEWYGYIVLKFTDHFTYMYVCVYP